MTEQAPEELNGDAPSFMDQETIDELNKQHPAQVVSTLPQYERLDPTKEGAWKMVSVGSTPVAVVWTDWENGAGIIPIGDAEESEDLFQYYLANIRMGTKPGIAYSSSHVTKGFKFGEEMSGPLSGVMSTIEDTIKRES